MLLLNEIVKLNKEMYLKMVKLSKKYNMGIGSIIMESDKTIIKIWPKDKNKNSTGDEMLLELSNKEYRK